MMLRTHFCLLLSVVLVALVALSGCYSTPVRHLTADVSLLKIGQSTEQDVQIYLGAPDEQQKQGGGVEKWVYNERESSFFEKLPLVGKHIGSPEEQQVVVTLTNKIVTDVSYSSTDKDDLDWADDYSWQVKKK